MTYSIVYTERVKKNIKKLDHYTKRMLKAWIDKHLLDCENPRAFGKGLTSNRTGQWRYRIGDYRLICEINDTELIILALSV